MKIHENAQWQEGWRQVDTEPMQNITNSDREPKSAICLHMGNLEDLLIPLPFTCAACIFYICSVRPKRLRPRGVLEPRCQDPGAWA